MKKSENTLFRILFYQEKKRYDIYARNLITNEAMIGFVGIENIIFNETSGEIIDAAEEKLKAEFGDVKSFYISYHDIIRIDEVEKSGTPKIIESEREGGSNIIRPTAFNSVPTPAEKY